ncbi:MAG: acyl-CoA synthetase [Acidimicrobiaceae bacterium]|nr:acyl-CoA synthetase [Acidimicrobiaceae bacterium]
MHPGLWAERDPDKVAVFVAGSDVVLTYRELASRTARFGRYLQSVGLKPGDHVAVFMENHPRFFEIAWGGFTAGLHVTAVNRHLSLEEAVYVIADSGASVVVTTMQLQDVARRFPNAVPGCDRWLMVDGTVTGFESYEQVVGASSDEPFPPTSLLGDTMLYSSGTTGRPKGIRRPPQGRTLGEGLELAPFLSGAFGFDASSVYLSPAPLYHSAPLGFTTTVLGLGGTVVMMPRFDPLDSLTAIERYKVTHSQWVPTMFIRLLRLPPAQRGAFDLSSHMVAIHAAAPCPRHVKEQMMEWWGPILHEYYSGTERPGITHVRPREWLARPGTVGRSLDATIHICDDAGSELPAGENGRIYFEKPGPRFEYHNDRAKTRASRHPEHPTWTTLDDVGWLDEEGFLYLTDRASFTIISGGVNIYPREIEDCLIRHPQVADVAVIGVPDDEMGESVKAVVQAIDGVQGSPALAEELIDFAGRHLAPFKRPRSVDFVDELPRSPTGKLHKGTLRERYWTGRDTSIG